MIFAYKAKATNNQEILEGTAEATDRFSLARDLRAKGNIPLHIEEKSAPAASFAFLKLFSDRVSADDLILLTKNLSGMLKAGLSLFRALSVLEKQTKKPALTKIFRSL